jgi:hypothetical protein
MKIMFLLFFVFSAPVALFLATILYGGHTRETVKKALADSPVYEQISQHFSKEDTQVMDQNDYPYFVDKRFTAEYFRNKTESTLDDSAAWISGRSQTVPVVSFKEIKDDIQKAHPDLLTAIEQTPTAEQLQSSDMTEEQAAQYLDQAKQLRTFSNNDFTVPLGQYLQSVKFVYGALKIALPIYVLILLASLVMIVLFANTIPAKCKWLGITFFLSSVLGFGAAMLYRANSDAITHLNFTDQTEFITLVTPIIVTVINHFAGVYAANQIIMSEILIALAALCFVGSFLTRKQADPSLKPLKVKSTYWTSPSKKKK